MKRLFSLCLAAIILLTACGAKKEKSLYAHGLELISLMGEMVQSDAYSEMFFSAPQVKESVEKTALAAAAGAYEKPACVYQISVGEEGLMGTLISAAEADINFDGMSEELKTYVKSRILSSFSSILNSSAGTEALAASSIYMCSKTFVCSEASENIAYLYLYEGASPILVTFLTGEDHAIYASSSYILSEDITDGESIASLFGISGFQVKELDIP
ncbi:MAG: hypothetical protein HFI67_08865 [Lachnospiraceae bacterium]|jgi:hypothetical protein|nr:hypothetical protein [Lachnospiraceae bacterium]